MSGAGRRASTNRPVVDAAAGGGAFLGSVEVIRCSWELGGVRLLCCRRSGQRRGGLQSPNSASSLSPPLFRSSTKSQGRDGCSAARRPLLCARILPAAAPARRFSIPRLLLASRPSPPRRIRNWGEPCASRLGSRSGSVAFDREPAEGAAARDGGPRARRYAATDSS